MVNGKPITNVNIGNAAAKNQERKNVIRYVNSQERLDDNKYIQ